MRSFSSPTTATLIICSRGCALSSKTQRKLNDHVVEQFGSKSVLTDQALLTPTFHKYIAATVQMAGLRPIAGIIFLRVKTSRKTAEKCVLEKEDLFKP